MLPPYSTLLRLTWRQYLQHFDLVLSGHLFFTLPMVTLAVYLKQWFPLADEITTLAHLWPNFFIQVCIDNVASIVASIVSVIIVMGMRLGTEEQSTNFTTVLWAALPFYLPIMLLNTVELILTMAGLTVFIIPGIIVAIFCTFATPALAWHKFSVWQAFQHSIKLVRGQFMNVLLYVVLAQLLLAVVILLITWSLPNIWYFNIFAAWISAVCASFYLIFTTIMMNATETLAELIPKKST